MKPLVLVGIILLTFGVIFAVIGLSTPEWSVREDNVGNDASGPFKRCNGNGYSCTDIDTFRLSSNHKAVRCFLVVGVIAAFICLACAAAPILGKEVPNGPLVVLITAIVAGILLLLASIIWGAGVHDDYSDVYDLGYSFALTLVAAFLLIIGGILIFVGGKGGGKSSPSG